MELEYHTLDVFTERVFGGNPLAVFPDAADVPERLMQRIARELNLAETVFLLPPESSEGTRRVRIFTPETEVPFAGHPTVGTAVFLAESGAVQLGPEGGRVVLEENVGPVPVDVEAGEGATFARFTAAIPPERRRSPWDRETLARLISLAPGEVGCAPPVAPEGAPWATDSLEPELVSLGLPFIVLPVRDLAAAGRARLDPAVWEATTVDAWSRMVYVVTTETAQPGADLHVRMFAPGAGVPEDPATGSAGAALAAYLGSRIPTDGLYAWEVEQGLEIGRPSRLFVDAEVRHGAVVRVRVGGSAVRVSSGVMRLGSAADDATG